MPFLRFTAISATREVNLKECRDAVVWSMVSQVVVQDLSWRSHKRGISWEHHQQHMGYTFFGCVCDNQQTWMS